MAPSPATPAAFSEALAAEPPDRPLVFLADGRETRPGYHVTRIRRSTSTSIDCTGRTDAWDEAVIEILDIAQGCGAPLTTGRAGDILGRGIGALDGAAGAPLVIEMARPGGAPSRHRVARLSADGARLVAELAPLDAACRPDLGPACCGPSVPADRAP